MGEEEKNNQNIEPSVANAPQDRPKPDKRTLTYILVIVGIAVVALILSIFGII